MGKRNTETRTITIAQSGTASSEIDLEEWAFGVLHMPSALNGSTYTIQAQNIETEAWADMLDSSGSAITITHVNSQPIRMPDAAFGAMKIRFRVDSQTTAARTLYVDLKS